MGGRGANSGSTVKSRFERLKNATTKQEAYAIMRENMKENNKNNSLTNKKDMISYIKKQTNIDISNYIEEKTSKSRTYLGVHLEKMPINQKNTIKYLMAQKGVRIEDNGGYGNAIYYKKNK